MYFKGIIRKYSFIFYGIFAILFIPEDLNFLWYHFLSFWRTSSSIFCIDGGLVIILLAFFYIKMLLFHLYSGRMLFYFWLLWASSQVLIFFFPSTFQSVFTLSLASIVSDKSQNLESLPSLELFLPFK